MNEKVKKALSKVKTGCYLLPCFLMAGGAAFAGNNRTAPAAAVELDSYDISKIEEVLKAEESTKTQQNTKVSSQKEKTSQKGTKSSKHGEAQSFLDGTYEGVGVGFAGHIKVKVVVENGKIISIELVEVEADDAPFVAKAKAVIDSILQYQTMDVDTISGATYSSKGIIAAVRNALEGVEDTSEVAPQKGKPAPTTVPVFGDAEYKDGVYYGTGIGFGGEVKVKVVIEDGKITEITVESAGGEDGSYLARTKTLIEKVLEKQSPNVDTVSGATYTSNGIISAIQNALSQAKIESENDDATDSTIEKGNQKSKESASGTGGTSGYQDGVYVGTAKGFRGDTKATVTIKKQKISKINIESKDDESFLKRAMTLVDIIIQKQSLEGIDVVTGATYSSNGILNSVKDALKKAASEEKTKPKNEDLFLTPTAKPTPGTSMPTTSPDDTSDGEGGASGTGETSKYKDGVYTGTAKGFRGDTKATVTIEKQKISKINIESKDDESFLKRAMTLVDTIILKQTPEGIDVVTGATYSSNGILNSVKDALKKAASEEETKPTGEDLTPTPTAKPTPSTSVPTTSPDDTTDGEDGAGIYKDGIYQAKGLGFNDYIVVEVVIQNGSISKINIKEYEDDEEFFWNAYNGVSAQILKKQITDRVDVVSGATYSSEGIIDAVKKALEQAKE